MIEELQNHGLKCCLNASTIDASILQQLPTKQPIYYCHNYYPRPDTGLSTDFVSAQNHLIRQFDSNSIIFAFYTRIRISWTTLLRTTYNRAA